MLHTKWSHWVLLTEHHPIQIYIYSIYIYSIYIYIQNVSEERQNSVVQSFRGHGEADEVHFRERGRESGHTWHYDHLHNQWSTGDTTSKHLQSRVTMFVRCFSFQNWLRSRCLSLVTAWSRWGVGGRSRRDGQRQDPGNKLRYPIAHSLAHGRAHQDLHRIIRIINYWNNQN